MFPFRRGAARGEAKRPTLLHSLARKYGDNGKEVVSIGVSAGGSAEEPMSNTGQIGVFKILAKVGVAAGVRRIRSYYGGALSITV